MLIGFQIFRLLVNWLVLTVWRAANSWPSAVHLTHSSGDRPTVLLKHTHTARDRAHQLVVGVCSPLCFPSRVSVGVTIAACQHTLPSTPSLFHTTVHTWMQVFILCTFVSYTQPQSLCLLLPPCLAFLLLSLFPVILSPRLLPHPCHSSLSPFLLSFFTLPWAPV